MFNVICVYKTGEIYSPEYVFNLYSGINKNTLLPVNFICLTDSKEINFCKTIKLKHGWPGWWSKIELFRLNISSFLYFDLDTIILDNIDQLLKLTETNSFLALRGFNQKTIRVTRKENFASGIMVGNFIQYQRVYEIFKQDPEKHINMFRENWKQGDQGFIADCIGINNIIKLQHYLSDNYVIGKKYLETNTIKNENKVIAWSGEPRLHQLPEQHLIKKYWGMK